MEHSTIPKELIPDDPAVVGDPLTQYDDLDEAREWAEQRDWVRVERCHTRWGTHTFESTIAVSKDAHVYSVVRDGPTSPPPSAEVIVRDLLATGGRDALVAIALASGWGIDLDELAVADLAREEVTA